MPKQSEPHASWENSPGERCIHAYLSETRLCLSHVSTLSELCARLSLPVSQIPALPQPYYQQSYLEPVHLIHNTAEICISGWLLTTSALFLPSIPRVPERLICASYTCTWTPKTACSGQKTEIADTDQRQTKDQSHEFALSSRGFYPQDTYILQA